MERVVLATHNPGKVAEMAALLAPYGVACVAAGDLGLPEPEETAADFAGNARLKAVAAALGAGLPALADDSGLAVAALGGAPGVHSARWAETPRGRDFAHAMRRVEAALGSAPDRSAAFICALALAWPNGRCEIFEGRIDGTIAFPPRGEGGFGYDPIFVPLGEVRTFAEMGPAEKDAISHRARAFEKLAVSVLCQNGSH